MELLQCPDDRGYPVEYLLSRIRGRRSELIRDWKALIFDLASLDRHVPARSRIGMSDTAPEAAWRRLMIEYRWVYGQMNGKLRETFKLFFLYAELRTLFICLRQMRDKKSARFEALLEESLLSDEIRSIFLKAADVPMAVAGISRIFSSLSTAFADLQERYEEGGIRMVERRMTNAYLAYAVETTTHPLMKAFFIRMVDARNIIRLAESVRQESATPPDFIAEGSIPLPQLTAIQQQRDLLATAALVRAYAGAKIDQPDPAQVEHALYAGTTRMLKRAGREPSGIGPILDYLWRCSIEAMNLSILFYGKDIERELISAELVA